MFSASHWSTRAMLSLAVALLTGCSRPRPEPERVTLHLNWTHEPEFAGFYVADAKGFYAEENLKVAFLESGPLADPSPQLIEKKVEFAVVPLRAQKRALEGREPIVTTMATFQLSPLVVFALAESGIRSPHDMIGKKVGIKNELWRKNVRDMLRNARVDPKSIIEVDVDFTAIEKLYNGEIDVWTGYAHSEPVEARLAGYEVNQLFPYEYGVGSYENLLAVHEDTLKENPDLVRRFMRASLEGWRYAVEHSEEAAQICARRQPKLSLDFHRMGMAALVPLIDTGLAPLGSIDAERWKDAMGEAFNPDRPGYTMEFVEGEGKSR